MIPELRALLDELEVERRRPVPAAPARVYRGNLDALDREVAEWEAKQQHAEGTES